jgi:hypothetical protein
LEVAVGLAVLAAVLMYGANAALQGSDQRNLGPDRTTAPQMSSAGWAEDNVRAGRRNCGRPVCTSAKSTAHTAANWLQR